MKINLKISPTLPAGVDLIVIPVVSDDMTSDESSSKKKGSAKQKPARRKSASLKNYGIDEKKLKETGFKGKLGESQLITRRLNTPTKSKAQMAKAPKEQWVLVVGMGEKKKIGVTEIREASSVVADFVRSANQFSHIASHLLDALPGKEQLPGIQAHGEGILMGSYSFEEYKSKKKQSKSVRVSIITVEDSHSLGSRSLALKRGWRIGEAVNFARDLVNEPGGSLTPREFANRASAMARKTGLRCKVMNLAAIKQAKMGGLLGVNRGSEQEPRFVELTYVPKGRQMGHLALVGKGITFDSGGLSLKPANAMMTMKCDMGGGAAVLGAMSVMSNLNLPIKVSAYVPMTDNMTGGDATRPGDVLVTHNKKTVEVLNTDAEGRLILADALSIASKAGPDAILDLATLTGACVVALGEDIAGVMGNNKDWIAQIESASDQTGEQVWELPLPPEYKKQLESPIADLKNIGSNYGGTLTAGLFLQEFVDEDIAWAHLDIAGPAYIEKSNPSGGTGFGVRLIVSLASGFKKPK